MACIRAEIRARGAVTTVGLIVNPIAGIGGSAGLKGSDDPRIQAQALERGAEPRAGARAAQALRALAARASVRMVVPPGHMGEATVACSGVDFEVIPMSLRPVTTAADTQAAAREIARRNLDLLLFTGGDGTARDVATAIGSRIPALGIPAGVKIYSACYAVSPAAAGEASAAFLADPARPTVAAEVLDLDETAAREGRASPRLAGALAVPAAGGRLQGRKAPTPLSQAEAVHAAARAAVALMRDDLRYVLGPGGTTAAISAELDLPATLLGVDVIDRHRVIAADVSESELYRLVSAAPSRVIVTVIGGQGFLLGRGNQQISPRVVRVVGRDGLIVVCDKHKLVNLAGRPLLVDTGEPALDRELCGYARVITGHDATAVYPVTDRP